MAKTKQAPALTHTELLVYAGENLNNKINSINEMYGSGSPMAEIWESKLEIVKSLYRIETGSNLEL